jgi:hypothetical protein
MGGESDEKYIFILMRKHDGEIISYADDSKCRTIS